METKNKNKGILLNDKTLFENIKEFNLELDQKKRVEYVKNFLYKNGMLKEDIAYLYNCMCNPKNNKKKSPFDNNQIELFFETITNYILYAPDDDSGLIDKHAKQIIDEKQIISADGFQYIDNDINDMYKNNNKNEYKDNKIKIDYNEVYDENYIEEKLANIKVDDEKRVQLKNIYTTYHGALVQVQEAIDDLVHKKIKHSRSYLKKYKFKTDIVNNVVYYLLVEIIVDSETGEITENVITCNKYLKFIIDRLKIEHRNNGYEQFMKYLASKGILDETITISNYIKIAKESYPEFKIQTIEYVYNDVNEKKVNNIIKELRWEMIALKKGFLRVLSPNAGGDSSYDQDYVDYQTRNATEITHVDTLDKKVINALLSCHYNKDVYDFSTNIDCVMYDFKQLISQCRFNTDQLTIVDLMEKGYKWESKSRKEPTVARMMGKNGLAAWQQFKGIVNIVDNTSELIQNRDWYKLNIVKGTYKKCPVCGEIKLIEEYNPHPLTKDGVQTVCKECQREDNRKRKRCTKCKKMKYESEFGRDSRKKDGLQSFCKKCDRERKQKR